MRKYMFAAAAAIAVHGAAFSQRVAHWGIEEARNKRLLEYRGEVEMQSYDRKLKLNLKNRSRDSLYVDVETGRTFTPDNQSYQPLVVTRGKTVKLGPGESRIVHINALCGDSPKKSAHTGETGFNRSELTNHKLRHILGFMEKNNLDNFPGIQQIIWSFTNNHQLAGITPDGIESKQYRMIMSEVAKQAGGTVPWYVLYYKKPPADSDILFIDEPLRLEGNITYRIEESTDVHFVLKDNTKSVRRSLKIINRQNPGEYFMPLKVGVENLAKGEYTIAVEDAGGKVISELPFRI